MPDNKHSICATFFRRLSCAAGEIARLADDLAEWADENAIPVKTAHQINLMLDELVANTVMHDYCHRDDGVIEVSGCYDGATVSIVLRDEGPPFDPTRLPEADTEKSLEEREIGGLGVHFVRRLADHFSYRRDGTVNEVVFCKAVAPSVPAKGE